MKTIFLFLCLMFTISGSSQHTIEQYCQVEVRGKFLSRKDVIYVDFGEPKKGVFDSQKLKDEEGNDLEFNNAIDAFNYLGKLGWKLAFVLYKPENSNLSSHVYIFKKEVLVSEDE